MKKKRTASLLAGLGLALTSFTASAQLINVQFAQGQAAVSPAYTGQGVLTGGTFWNELQTPGGNGFSNVGLSDSSGTSTNVTLSTTSVGFYDQQNTSNGSAEDALLQNYIYKSVFHGPPYSAADEANLTITLTLNGLAANTAYNLVVYDGGNPTSYSLNGGAPEAVVGAGYNASATFQDGLTYAELTGVSSDSGVLSLQAFVTGDNGEPDISAIQFEVAATPEPSVYAMMAAGLGLLILVGRVAKNRTA